MYSVERNGDHAIVVESLTKAFAGKPALDGLDLAVRTGTVHGLLGPNGAGKTTAVRIMTTLLQPDSGRAEVAGFDVVRRASEVRRRIGLVGQHAAVDEVIGARQNLEMFGRLHHLSGPAARRRADELLDQFGLADTGRKPAGTFSGGMRRRLDLAAGLIMTPPVLFLDEPTTGLDPRGRGEVWEAVREIAAQGTTVLLTTQYLDEADQLADHISVIRNGHNVADGTPEDLKTGIGGDRIEVILHRAGDLAAAAEIIGRVTDAQPDIDRDLRQIGAPVRDRVGALVEAVRALDAKGLTVEDISLRRPTLDEVFLEVTS